MHDFIGPATYEKPVEQCEFYVGSGGVLPHKNQIVDLLDALTDTHKSARVTYVDRNRNTYRVVLIIDSTQLTLL